MNSRILCWLILTVTLHGQEEAANVLWREAGPDRTIPGKPWIHPPARARVFELNHAALSKILARAPREFASGQVPALISLPMPDARLAAFRVVASPVMAPELAAKFPEINTYFGQGVDDPAATVRFDITPSGLHAQILAPDGAVYIDPELRNNAHRHISYNKRDYLSAADFKCLATDDQGVMREALSANVTLPPAGTTLRTYRLAVAATGEYTEFHGGTVAAGLAAIVTAINRVNGIYESELAIRLELVANNDQLVFTNAATDPYSTNISAMLTENQSAIDNVIGELNYDLGHLFCTGDGGLSRPGVVCLQGAQAHAVSGQPEPVGDPYQVDYVAHEIGHQFGAHHTFNGNKGFCSGSRTASIAYEPGSGSTIMAYAGVCGTDNLQPHSSPYFHGVSRDEIRFYITVGFGGDCGLATMTGNNLPVVNVGPITNFAIPKGTPFTLTASASDPDNDVITYCWEERDLGPTQSISDPDNGSSPLFRSFPPTTNASRTFPRLPDLLNNTNSPGEKLPVLSRNMRFRVTARDNRGGVASTNVLVTVVGSAGPFVVTTPNSAVTWMDTNTVTWNVAGTTISQIGAATVDILLSSDGGLTFPFVLAADTQNDGAEFVTLPNIVTTNARVKVQAHGNIFFDISDTDFAIARRPLLSIGQTGSVITVSWPGPAPGWVLDEGLDLDTSSTSWSEIPVATYQTNATQIFVTDIVRDRAKFFRLRK